MDNFKLREREDQLIEPIEFYNNLDYGGIYEQIKNNTHFVSHQRVGEQKYNSSGKSLMTIIEYYNSMKITILMESEDIYGNKLSYIKYNQAYSDFRKGSIKSPYESSIFDVGYIGGNRNKTTDYIYYKIWQPMFQRCYSQIRLLNNPTYQGCEVHPYFHNFQNFAYWCDINYYEVEGETMNLDKDILYQGNKIYGPNTCIFIPHRINTLFTINRSHHNSELPIGCNIDKEKVNRKYYVKIKADGKNKHVGYFATKDEARLAYKFAKEAEIRRVVSQYKGRIPEFHYNLLMNYNLSI